MQTLETSLLKEQVHQLAEEAFQRKLISGYGDGEYRDGYQIVLDGKPRHFSLRYAHEFLKKLMVSDR